MKYLPAPLGAIRDGIEDGRVGLCRGSSVAPVCQYCLDRSGQSDGQRDLGKNQWLVRHGGVKECETPPVGGRQTGAQGVPGVDGVHCFIGDDFSKSAAGLFQSMQWAPKS